MKTCRPDFIDAINVTDLSQATKWTVNANNVNDDGRGVMFADERGTKISFRNVRSTGATESQRQIDLFPTYYDYDSYNLDPSDFARGPWIIGTHAWTFADCKTSQSITRVVMLLQLGAVCSSLVGRGASR